MPFIPDLRFEHGKGKTMFFLFSLFPPPPVTQPIQNWGPRTMNTAPSHVN
jgi:hypothetical protein